MRPGFGLESVGQYTILPALNLTRENCSRDRLAERYF